MVFEPLPGKGVGKIFNLKEGISNRTEKGAIRLKKRNIRPGWGED
jgi:hypothetical protein